MMPQRILCAHTILKESMHSKPCRGWRGIVRGGEANHLVQLGVESANDHPDDALLKAGDLFPKAWPLLPKLVSGQLPEGLGLLFPWSNGALHTLLIQLCAERFSLRGVHLGGGMCGRV